MRAALDAFLAAALVVTLAPAPARAQATPVPPRDPSLPAGEETARAALESSPRHGEYVDVKVDGGKAPIRTWVVYPERKDKAGVEIVIHEIFGLSDWIAPPGQLRARLSGWRPIVSGTAPGGHLRQPRRVWELVREDLPEEGRQLNAVRDSHSSFRRRTASPRRSAGAAGSFAARLGSRPERRGRVLRHLASAAASASSPPCSAACVTPRPRRRR
jgi:hypothetical protein